MANQDRDLGRSRARETNNQMQGKSGVKAEALTLGQQPKKNPKRGGGINRATHGGFMRGR